MTPVSDSFRWLVEAIAERREVKNMPEKGRVSALFKTSRRIDGFYSKTVGLTVSRSPKKLALATCIGPWSDAKGSLKKYLDQ
jgi:hypothetical protein